MSVSYDENGKWRPPERWAKEMDREKAREGGGGGGTDAARNISASGLSRNNNNAKEVTVGVYNHLCIHDFVYEHLNEYKRH